MDFIFSCLPICFVTHENITQNIWVSVKECNPCQHNVRHALPTKSIDYYAIMLYVKHEEKLLIVDGSIGATCFCYCLFREEACYLRTVVPTFSNINSEKER